MANIKQQKKRNKTNETRRLRNAAFKASVRTAVKRFKNYVTSVEEEKATLFLRLVHKKLDKGLSKGVFGANFVARQKSRLSKLFNNMQT
ncbi:MAG: 30S ribosomal protein S20 [Weeping tea tree witches'-broom phytoplasma]|uniref:30S ribosomal protein S20 n=1 Tax=Candidatus Phytoplasma melaleucae TaxID=2982630 RepID=UPI00293A8DD0|nr:30S ribosomal protein S20 [Weeping tea tree witches'-broom phytoplasma]